MDIKCDNCGKISERYPSQIGKGLMFCNRKCQFKYHEKRRKEIICAYCGKKLIREKIPHEIEKNNFCNIECYHKWRKIEVNKLSNHTCIDCGNEFIGKIGSLYCPNCTEMGYCYKWDENCKERNREKYNRECFFCGKSEEENGQKLDVHHTDNNKNQGCDDTPDWKLVPLCVSCHSLTKGGIENRELWTTRILYLHKEYWRIQ